MLGFLRILRKPGVCYSQARESWFRYQLLCLNDRGPRGCASLYSGFALLCSSSRQLFRIQNQALS